MEPRSAGRPAAAVYGCLNRLRIVQERGRTLPQLRSSRRCLTLNTVLPAKPLRHGSMPLKAWTLMASRWSVDQ